MNDRKLGVAIIGCGNIANAYARNIASYPQVEMHGMADLEFVRAEKLAAEHGCRAYPSVEALLADDGVDLVVNLTTHTAHKAVTTLALEAGKHVHSEKPLALTYEDAQELVRLAGEKGVRLGSSPVTFMGEAQQTAWKVIREGRLGPVRLVYAEVNWGRIESWHPAPEGFYEVGALFDVGVYPLTIVTTFFGPARRVLAYGTVLYPDRVTKDGIPFHIETPDFVVAALELENGTVVRLTTNFYVGHHNKQKGIEFHGDAGSLHISSWQDFNATVEFAEFGTKYEPVPYVKEPYPGIEWGRAVVDLAEALAEGRPHRATGEQAAHIVEILGATVESIKSGRPVDIHSDFRRPAPMEWAMGSDE